MKAYIITTAAGEVFATTSLAAIYDHLTPTQVGVSLSRLYHLPLPYTSPRCAISEVPLYRKMSKKTRSVVAPKRGRPRKNIET